MRNTVLIKTCTFRLNIIMIHYSQVSADNQNKSLGSSREHGKGSGLKGLKDFLLSSVDDLTIIARE